MTSCLPAPHRATRAGGPPSRRIAGVGRALALTLLLAACGDDPVAPPGVLGDGRAGRWPTASPASQGLDADVLLDLAGEIDGGIHGEITSLLVLRNGRLVFERYWNGAGPADLHVVNSVTKSVTSLLVGIAVHEGTLPPTSTPILDLLPPWDDLADPDGKAAITLEHVLTMRTGLEWDELSTNYAEAVNPVAALAGSPDWPRFTMELPLTAEPGTRFAYNSGVSVLMSAALDRALGRTAEDFAAERLFAPLGIQDWQWTRTAGGLSNAGWGLSLRPRDMAALGQLLLQGGAWDGAQVVPAPWIEASARAATTFVGGTGYGYQWWLGRDDGAGRLVAGWGYGGQFIVAIPSLGVVMVTTAENFLGGGFNPWTLAEWGYRAAGATPP